MMSFLLRKIKKNIGLILSLIIGNILLVGIISATPLYTTATMQRIFIHDLRQLEYPASVNISFCFKSAPTGEELHFFNETEQIFLYDIIQDFDTPIIGINRILTLEDWHMTPLIQREERPLVRPFDITSSESFELDIIHGRMPSDYLIDGNILEVIATDELLIRHDIFVGELLDAQNGFYVRVVGIFESDSIHTLVMSDTLAQNEFLDLKADWTIIFDYNAMRVKNFDLYLQSIDSNIARYNNTGIWEFSENFSETIFNHQDKTIPLGYTLMIIQVPIYVLLALYIYMVSRQIFLIERDTISIIASRGAGRLQILGIYIMQGVFIAIISIIPGLLLGMLFCNLLGSTSGFLHMVQRTPLTIEMNINIILQSVIALFISFIIMLLPIITFSKINIVEHKRKKVIDKKPVWQRFYLDILCIMSSYYILFLFENGQISSESQTIDPLLLGSSSLLIMGLGLFALRIYPYIIKILFLIGKRFWSVATYASLLKAMRTGQEEQFVMIFIIFTVSFGIFGTQTAGTINNNNEYQIRLVAGADLTFLEHWQDNTPPVAAVRPGIEVAQTPHRLIFQEPDFERFTNFLEVESITKVKRQYTPNIQIMAIESDTFGNTINFRDDFLPIHINYFLNALASFPNGVLLSDNFRTRYSIGDTIIFNDNFDNTAEGYIVGFVERWPGFISGDNFLIANLGHLQTIWGVYPYEIWMKTISNNFFYDLDITLLELTDTNANIITSRNDPILQGINGVLTLSFLAALIICFFGLIIYWILSIHADIFKFGVFRAMGMSMGSIIKMLINEQIAVTGLSIIIGGLIGFISARAFVPIIQISFTGTGQIIPVDVIADFGIHRGMFILIGLMVVVCLIILGIYVSRLKIAQALRLGED